MRTWGVVITVLYALVLVFLLMPAAAYILDDGDIQAIYKSWWGWCFAGVLVLCQAALIFLAVDVSQRPKPRAHILVSCLITGATFTALTGAAILSVGTAVRGLNSLSEAVFVPVFWAGLWAAWTILLFLYTRNSSKRLTQTISWILKGSVLELLIAVPCHVLVRRRHDCSAPIFTGFGISTGIAIMMFAFGPSVLLLYKKRLDEYNKRGASAKIVI